MDKHTHINIELVNVRDEETEQNIYRKISCTVGQFVNQTIFKK